MKKVNTVLIYFISLLSLVVFFRGLNTLTIDRLLPCLLLIPVLFIPRILRRLFKIRINNMLELIYIIFIILAMFTGACLNIYNKVWWYDIFAHFLSGLLTSVLALIIMSYLKVYDKKNIGFNILYIISFTLMIASVWEFLEFGADNIMNLNTQHSIDTGVRDTMEDMLTAFAGSIIISIMYFCETKHNKKGIITKAVEDKE